MKKKTAAAVMTATLTFAIMLTGCGNSGGQDDASGSADTRTEGSKDSVSGKAGDNSGNDQKEENELVWKAVSMVEYVSGKAGDEAMEEQISRKEEGTYDKNGNLLTVTASLGEGAEEMYNPKYYAYKYEYAYDDQERVIEEKKYDADGNLTLITKKEYSDDGLTMTETFYDADGNASADSYGRSQWVYEYYDKDHTQEKAVFEYKKVEGSDEPFLDEEDHYDEHGNTTLTVYYYSGGSKSVARREYTYDEHGAEMTYDRYWNDVLTDHEEYQVFHDEKTDEWISKTTLSVEYDSNTGTEKERVVYSYDAKGQLQSRLITTGEEQIFKSESVSEFDANGRLTSTTDYQDQDHTMLNFRKLYEYDAVGNQIKYVEETYRSYDGTFLSTSVIEYDAQGRTLKEQKKYEGDDYYYTWEEYTYEKDYEQYKTYKDYYHDVLEKECEVSFDDRGNILEETERTYVYDAGELIGETVIRRVYEWKAFEVK